MTKNKTLSGVRTPVLRALTVGAAAIWLAGCPAKGNEVPDGDCVATDKYFANEVWAPVLSTNCFQCHSAQGAARDSQFVLQGSGQTGFLDANYETTRKIAAFEVDGTSVLLLKPSAQIDHGGGLRLEAGSEQYEALALMVEQFRDPVVCEGEDNGDFFAGVVMLDDRAVLRKLTLNLAGRLPTDAELELAASQGEAGVHATLDQVMTEDAFYDRLVEIYNDQLLTDRYYFDGANLLDRDDYPNARFYDALPEDTEEQRILKSDIRRRVHRAVGREPLELIRHVVKNNRPFTEILTADYILLNPFSARSYGVSGFEYQDGTPVGPYDETDFREARLPSVPHAGLLSSHIFLNRFPTTATNVNRHRSRMVYRFFLATDVLKLAERPVDPTSIQDFNPTLYNPACNVCHATIDPVAGAFQNWDDRGRFRIPDMGWNEDMLPPGFGEQMVGYENRGTSLKWLASAITSDERFATAAIHTMFRAITGTEPLDGLTEFDTPEVAAAKLAAFEVQSDFFKSVREAFAADNYNLKTVIKMLATSPYVRADGFVGDMDSSRSLRLDQVGTARLLTPEALHRKIEAILGYSWERYSTRYLLDSSQFRIFYGGIDSDTITTRITEPNGVMSNIAMRMGNEMSCLAVAQDFRKARGLRLLFPLVETSFEPEDENGFEIPSAVAAIKDNIGYLHQRISGEGASDEEIERTYQLFLATVREGQAGIADESIEGWLPYQCQANSDPRTGEDYPDESRLRADDNYSVRAWMAVTTYLLADYDFLYE